MRQGHLQRQRLLSDGAAVAVGELYDMAALGRFLADDGEVRGYPASFNVRGMDDVDALGIRGPYRRDFERLCGLAEGKEGFDAG